MRFKYALVAFGVVCSVGVASLFSGNVLAEVNDKIELQGEEFQIAISPAYIEFDLVPGTTTSDKFRVRNVGSVETDIKIGVAPLSVSNEVTVNGTPRNEILGWTTIELDPGCEPTLEGDGFIEVHMRVKEECFVRFSTATPSNAPFGEQYMNIYFQEYTEDASGGMQMLRSIGVNVYGTNRTGESSGDMCGKLKDQKIPFWIMEAPLTTTTTVENCGRLNFRADVKIEVRNLFGKLVYDEKAPQSKMIVVDSERVIHDSWDDASIGIYKVKQTVEMLGETYVKEKWTFVIPLWLILVVLGCIVVIILAIVYDRKRRMKKAKR